jgi:membrane protease YdiL (CAAX protease family)
MTRAAAVKFLLQILKILLVCALVFLWVFFIMALFLSPLTEPLPYIAKCGIFGIIVFIVGKKRFQI